MLSSFREWDVVYFILASQIYLLQSVCAILSMYQFKLCLIFYIPTIRIAYSFFCAQSVPFILLDHKSLSERKEKKHETKQSRNWKFHYNISATFWTQKTNKAIYLRIWCCFFILLWFQWFRLKILDTQFNHRKSFRTSSKINTNSISSFYFSFNLIFTRFFYF